MDKEASCGVNMSSVLGEGFREYFRGLSVSKRGVQPALSRRPCWSCFSVLGPTRRLTCVCWEVRVEEAERRREGGVGRGEEEEGKKEDERDTGRGIGQGKGEKDK